MSSYVLGIDFGSLSGRAAVVRVSDGAVLGTADTQYRHQVMDQRLTAGDGQALPPSFALQNAPDYLEVLWDAVPRAVEASGVYPADIVGIGLDVTAATVVAAKADGRPLSTLPEFADHPHAYVKMWKHHGAHEQADRMVRLARERGDAWLDRFGGVISSELMVPKLLETLEEDRAVYDATDVFVDASDWLVWQLTGTLSYAAGLAGYKRLVVDGRNLPSDYLAALNPDFARVFDDKMVGPIIPLGGKAGQLQPEVAAHMGLPAGIAVAAGNIDAHANAPAAKGVEPGQLVAGMGTSTAAVLCHPDLRAVPGAFGIVDGGVVDGLWGYEVGQTSVGDTFAWFVANCVPQRYFDEAAEAGVSVHQLLSDLSAGQAVGEHGLLALDWNGGTRSVLMDPNLSGMILGLTLQTPAESIYRALVEATAFGMRRIIQAFRDSGIEVTEFIATGGLLKNRVLMQIYADVLNMDISIATNAQNAALGSAIFAAVAAGEYPTVAAAADAMGDKRVAAYRPDPVRAAGYDILYDRYSVLHDYFGRGTNEVMHELKALQRRVLREGRV